MADTTANTGANAAETTAALVQKIDSLPFKAAAVQDAESIRGMIAALSGGDVTVILALLERKLERLRRALPDAVKQKEFARQCLEIYAPLADRLGVMRIKYEMEDLSLKITNPEAWAQIENIVRGRRAEGGRFLEQVCARLRTEAENIGIPVEAASRVKHFYSIYRKMRKRNKSAADIYDIYGVRLLCGGEEHCYSLLGLVHRLYRPVAGRFKDYIARPKANGYRSLHTTVELASPAGLSSPAGLLAAGFVLEIQIRSRDMQEVAENGAASHRLYKLGRAAEFAAVRPQKDAVYVFTPQYQVIELPAGATPIDFAYRVHSAVGDHCVGAKADGAIIPLGAELKNTQVIEILTSPQAHPGVNWLQAVKTAKARAKIRAWLENNDEAAVEAKKRAQAAAAQAAKANADTQPGTAAQSTAGAALNAETGFQNIVKDSGDRGVLHIKVDSDPDPSQKNMMIRFAHCCRPVIGDDIVGYVSRGRGIIIHRASCTNLANIPDFAERRIETRWDSGRALVKRFAVEAKFSKDLFAEIEGAVRREGGHLIEGRLEQDAPNRLRGLFTMELENGGNLKPLMKHIRGIPSVLSLQGRD